MSQKWAPVCKIKKKFWSIETAQTAADSYNASNKTTKGHHPELYAYKCKDCGLHHLATQKWRIK